MRLHAAIQRSRSALHEISGQRFRDPRLPREQFQKPGTGHRSADRRVLPGQLWRDLSDVLQNRCATAKQSTVVSLPDRSRLRSAISRRSEMEFRKVSDFAGWTDRWEISFAGEADE